MGSVQFELSVCADGHIDGQAYKPVVPDVCLGQTPSKTEYFPARVSLMRPVSLTRNLLCAPVACPPSSARSCYRSRIASPEAAKRQRRKCCAMCRRNCTRSSITIAPPRTQTNPNQLRARPRMCLLLATRQITQEQAPRSKHARLPAIFHFGIEVGPALALAAALAARVCNVAPLERAPAQSAQHFASFSFRNPGVYVGHGRLAFVASFPAVRARWARRRVWLHACVRSHNDHSAVGWR